MQNREIYFLVCWIRRHLPKSREQRELLREVMETFAKHNDELMDPKRRAFYHGLIWSRGCVDIREAGVWDKAQGMPHDWSVESVKETLEHYRAARRHDGAYHAKIQGLLRKPCLDGIIAVDGRLKRGREQCSKIGWSIDDGCMRAVAMALKGHTRIPCYLGRI